MSPIPAQSPVHAKAIESSKPPTNQQSRASQLDERRVAVKQPQQQSQQLKPSAPQIQVHKPPIGRQSSNTSVGNTLQPPQARNTNNDSSVERMIQVNEKLKAELLEVINKMDGQIRKFEEKRRAKIENELKTNAALQDKDQKIKKKARTFQKLKQEITEMWQQLESSYNIDAINRLEDELKDKTKKLDGLKGDA
jgi:chromosome segregation ATPase